MEVASGADRDGVGGGSVSAAIRVTLTDESFPAGRSLQIKVELPSQLNETTERGYLESVSTMMREATRALVNAIKENQMTEANE